MALTKLYFAMSRQLQPIPLMNTPRNLQVGYIKHGNQSLAVFNICSFREQIQFQFGDTFQLGTLEFLCPSGLQCRYVTICNYYYSVTVTIC